jgi:mRNA-degrading endonuclease YafQ of YafQ-DinJ toxin-antitoxin module
MEARAFSSLGECVNYFSIPHAILDIPTVAMWRIEEHQRLDKKLRNVPAEVLKRYEKWKDIAMLSGTAGLRMIKGSHDESLKGKWKGYRSSRLGIQWRVIYRVSASDLLIRVSAVSPHKYEK